MNKLTRMKSLITQLNQANKAYYQDNNEIMSNKQYDALYDELLQLEQKTGIVMSNSPTQKVGYEIKSKLQKVAHDVLALSLDKKKDIEELKKWLGDKVGVLSWKLDGLTVVLDYNNGEFVRAITRGDSEIGEDVTHNVKTFVNLPLNISYKGKLQIRGEALISYQSFKEINSKLSVEDQYKNSRSLASGSVRQLDSKIAAQRNMRFVAFECVTDINKRYMNRLLWLKEQGFETVYFTNVNNFNIEENVECFKENVEINPYPSDGLVLTFDDIEYGQSLGNTSKFPRHSMAFKWADESQETILRNIEWQVSRTGAINPVAIFDPVEIDGTTVTRASVHNLSIIEELELGISDTILVYKANLIIPQIEDNLTRSNNIIVPKECPVCGSKTEIRQIKDSKVLYCTNKTCVAQQIKAIQHYVSRDAMNIVGMSEATIEKFVEKGFLKNVVDLYKLEQHKQEIITMDGFGVKSYNNLIQSIEESKKTKLSNIIYALGIEHVGKSTAKALCEGFANDITEIATASIEALKYVGDIGDKTAEAIHDYFNETNNIKLVSNILQYLNLKEEIKMSNNILEGKIFVVTGAVNHFKNRKELQAKIEELGGKISSSVSKNTSYLINNESTSTTGKNKAAKELGINIITEEQFLEMIGA